MSLDEIAQSLSLSRGLIRETREKALKKVETRLTKQIRKTK
ncbi:MAG: hypothetical protein KGZ30_01005 [Anaplasmataceae bacterium]|nr:hypothetical protein [Anaplasmataceae bacterium]